MQHEKNRLSLETELRDLQAKISSFEEGKLKSNLESTSRIEELENKIRKLELEKDQLVNSQEMLKKRHEDEIKAMENSHKYVCVVQTMFMYALAFLVYDV